MSLLPALEKLSGRNLKKDVVVGVLPPCLRED